ncbi:MAG TPA: hypothetical protein VK157_13350 [Phycisphaerales bacterium]|nr:hypothetical protein [Phycisphaerales bacterium]
MFKFAASLVLCLASSAIAQPLFYTRVTVNAGAGGSGPFDQTVSQAQPTFVRGSATGVSGAFGIPNGGGYARTRPGNITLGGFANGSCSSVCVGELRDTLNFSSPAIPAGTFVSATIAIRVSGGISANSGSSAGTWNAQIGLDGAVFNIARTGSFYSPTFSTPGYVGDPLGVYTATVNFRFGQPVDLFIRLRGAAVSSNTTLGGAGASAFGSPLELQWLGFSNITANGQPVSNVSVTSLTGTNWLPDLTPPACDPIDFNNNDVFPEDQDVIDFFTVLAGGNCPLCNDIDFNNNTVFPEDQDVIDFFTVLAGGEC